MYDAIFDPAFYGQRHGLGDRGSLKHFIARGDRLGLDPGPYFSTRYYKQRYPDWQVGGAATAAADFLQRIAAGEMRQPHPLIDPAYYLARYPDLAGLGAAAALHFMAHGDAEVRAPSVGFDADFYQRCYLALDQRQPFRHFITEGQQLGHMPKPWWRDYTEANGWQATFLNQHDVYGLIRHMGGDAKFEAKLDELFSAPSTLPKNAPPDISGLVGQYAHGNEPDQHVAYLYAYVGAPWKTQRMVRRLLTEMYKNAPDGIIGNDDCGQMSAWFLFSALGFYPVDPVSGAYVFGGPLFDRAQALAIRAHERFREGFTLIGWDIGLTAQGPVLIEGNWNPGTDIVQLVNGKGEAGFGVAEANDPASIQKWVLHWSDMMTMEVKVALTDEQIAPLLAAAAGK